VRLFWASLNDERKPKESHVQVRFPVGHFVAFELDGNVLDSEQPHCVVNVLQGVLVRR
jgi:hypothetical protein